MDNSILLHDEEFPFEPNEEPQLIFRFDAQDVCFAVISVKSVMNEYDFISVSMNP